MIGYSNLKHFIFSMLKYAIPTPVENGELTFFRQSKKEASQSQCDLKFKSINLLVDGP